MSDFMDRFFGPLSKDACVYFLFISMIFFTLLAFTLVADFVYIIKNFKFLTLKTFTGAFMLTFNL